MEDVMKSSEVCITLPSILPVISTFIPKLTCIMVANFMLIDFAAVVSSRQHYSRIQQEGDGRRENIRQETDGR